MARNKYSGMGLEELQKIGFELISKMESMGDDAHPLEVVKIQREMSDISEMVYSLQNDIPIENIENQFYGKSTEEIQERFYKLLDEIDVASEDDSVPAKVLADMYRELADAIELIGNIEENTEG